jgi:formylglycine-generating enzyme required for sulfatase activity
MILNRVLLLLSLTAGSNIALAEFAPFDQTIPDTDKVIAMVPIKGGSFTMGSPETEHGRSAAEGPMHPVDVDDFWMG